MLFIRSARDQLGAEQSDAHEPRQVRVRVAGGYVPDTIRAEAGVPLRILFFRVETAPCSEQVVFPAFGQSAMLPWRQEVAVDLLPEEPGEYEFTCGMEMLRGTLVISPAGRAADSANPGYRLRGADYDKGPAPCSSR